MTIFRGSVPLTPDAPQLGPEPPGAGIRGTGLSPVKCWLADGALLALAQRVFTAEDAVEQQPERDAAGAVVMFDGRLTEREALADTLGISAAAPDSVLAAHFLARRPPERLRELAGDWALARWHPASRTLLLAVAPMADRSLYFYASGLRAWFATVPAALHGFSAVPRDLNEEDLAVRFAAQMVDPLATPYRNIWHVPHGTTATIDARGVRRQRFWDLKGRRQIRFARDDDYVEATRDLLDRAVARCRRTQGTLAVSMSGGYDSSAVAATAARQMAPNRLACYTMVPGYHPPSTPPRCYSDESDKVRAIAAMHPNIDLTLIPADKDAVFEEDPASTYALTGLPMPNAEHVSWFNPLMRAIAGDGHRVMLTGDFGNFTLSFDATALTGDMIRTKPSWLRHIRRFQRETEHPWKTVLLGFVLLPLLPPAWQARLSAQRRPHEGVDNVIAIDADYARRTRLRERLADAGFNGSVIRPGDRQAWMHHWIVERRSSRVELASNARALCSFDMRDPLADVDLVEFLTAIPLEQYLKDGVPSSLARRVLADRLPPVILADRRLGLQNPEWFARIGPRRDKLRAEVERMAQTPIAREMFDLPRLRQTLDTWPATAEEAHARELEIRWRLMNAVAAARYLRWVTGSNA